MHANKIPRPVKGADSGMPCAGELVRGECEISPANANRTGRRVCMLAYTFYEFDNRVRRYAETLAERGDQVDVIALSSPYFEDPVGQINGVRVYRIQSREYNETSEWSYAGRLFRFLLRSSIFLRRMDRNYHYDVVHVHNMPDFLVYAGWYPKQKGAKLILDVHDIVPELFANKFKTRLRGFYCSLLKRVEKASASFVDHVIVSNDLWRNTLVSRSVTAGKCSVFLNHVDLSIFYRHSRSRHDDRFIVLFPGSLQWHQGLDIGIKAFAVFKKEVPNAEFHIYSGGGENQKAELITLSRQLGLGDSVKFQGGVALDQIPQIIADADLGVVPKRADSFGNEAYSTKIMEFMSQGLPVIASRTKIDTFYFDDTAVQFFESGNHEDMARAMLEVYRSKELRARLVSRGLEYAEQNSWERRKEEYLTLIDNLSMEASRQPPDQKRVPITKLVRQSR